MANGGNGFVLVEERFHELDRFFVHAERIGILHPARLQEGIVILRVGGAQRHVHFDRPSRLIVLPSLDLAFTGGDDFGFGAGFLERLTRLY